MLDTDVHNKIESITKFNRNKFRHTQMTNDNLTKNEQTNLCPKHNPKIK